MADTHTEAWVEVKLWINERGQKSKLTFRGKLQQLELDREVVVMNLGYAAMSEYLPAGRMGTIRWAAEGWKMDHGSPKGFRPTGDGRALIRSYNDG